MTGVVAVTLSPLQKIATDGSFSTKHLGVTIRQVRRWMDVRAARGSVTNVIRGNRLNVSIIGDVAPITAEGTQDAY